MGRSPYAHTRVLTAALIAALLLAPAFAQGQGHDEPPSENGDCDLGRDAPDQRQDAAELDVPVFECAGRVPVGDMDWYRFHVPAGAKLHVWTEGNFYLPNSDDPYTCLISGDGAFRDCKTTGRWYVDVNTPGTWFVSFEGIWENTGYVLSASVHRQDARAEHVVESTFVTRNHVPGHGVTGFLGPSEEDGVDGTWVKLEEPARGGEYVDADGAYVYFYDADHQELPRERCNHFDYCGVPAGTHWVYVTGSQPLGVTNSMNNVWDIAYYH